MRKFYSMEKTESAAVINIHTDIYAGGKGSIDYLSKEIADLKDAKQIDVYINSNGGDVFEGLAIYNALKRHKAKIVTHCDGMAASIASVIFMAGDERIMPKSSFLMIHNAWGGICGNAEEMRKYADDLETVTEASVNIYKEHSNLTVEEIKALMDHETILTAEEAFEYGFATCLETTEDEGTKQSATNWLCNLVKKYREELENEEEEKPEEEEETATEEEETEEGGNSTDEDEGAPVEENAEDGTPASDTPEAPPEDEDEETPEDEENTEDEETENETEDEQPAAQKWCGIFNALKNI